jgi:SAM-dependent methyltransferase
MFETSRWSREAEDAYDAIAPFYDEFTAHHNYEDWLGSMLPELEAHGLTGNRLLDVACGTGKSLMPMLRRGWSVTGCDISAQMVAVAQSKVGAEVDLRVADVRELPEIGEFDLVLALGDIVNYLLDEAGLIAGLTRIRRNLAPTGLLLFDANTIHMYRTFFATEEVVERAEDRLIWRGRTAPDAAPGVTAEATFEVEPREQGRPRIGPDLHRERHFTRVDIEAALERAGLRALAVYGHEADAILHQPLDDDRDTKAIYIAAPA